MRPEIEPLGDGAFILRGFNRPAHALAELIRSAQLPGLIDAAASYDTVGIYTVPGSIDEATLGNSVEGLSEMELPKPTSHAIPVCYHFGEDTIEVCERLRISPEQLIEFHGTRRYECFAVGFCPGFAYLGWLADELQGVPRRPSPRTRVERGSVAITGRQTAVYPLDRPGGWSIVGKTPLTLVDVADNYFPITAGDNVSFFPISEDRFRELEDERL